MIHSKADDVELSYLFFEERASCTAIFELLKVRPEWLETGLIRRPELMNAIWKYAPMYAAAYNAQEQAGLHDGQRTPGIAGAYDLPGSGYRDRVHRVLEIAPPW